MNVEAYLDERGLYVDRALQERLDMSGVPDPLRAAMAHLVFPGGKRLRPILVFAACEALGRPGTCALPGAEAVELLHTYSLIHDDLPCMDDDDLRRGRPTVHTAHGEALAVLAGDALQALAFEVLASTSESWTTDAIQELAETAGARFLVGGQVDDLGCDPANLDLGLIHSVHRRKSAALFATSASLGARYGGAKEPQRQRLWRFGEKVGLAFQLADDLLDGGAPESCSILRVLDREAVEIRMNSYIEAALVEVEALGDSAEPLRELARFAVRRDQ